MDVVITEWSLNSYLDLKHAQVFSDQEYHSVLRPDAELLKKDWPPVDPKFSNSKFWGPTTSLGGKAFLCQGYVKTDDKVDKRQMATL
jgi:hypothetical protein